MTFRGVRVGVPICEDIWIEESADYENIVECLAETGAEILLVPNGSPYERDKDDVRLRSPSRGSPKAACRWSISTRSAGRMNWCSMARRSRCNADRSLAAQLPTFEESIVTLRMDQAARRLALHAGPMVPLVEGDKGDYAACVLGLRDYVHKNGFPGVVLGLSGGIDSALCAAMAVDALGAERVRGVMLPFASPRRSRSTMPPGCAKALGYALRRAADQGSRRRLSTHPGRCSQDGRAMSRKRISRRARAA